MTLTPPNHITPKLMSPELEAPLHQLITMCVDSGLKMEPLDRVIELTGWCYPLEAPSHPDRQFRARIVRDHHLDRPDQEMDFVSIIELPDDAHDRDDIITDLIDGTKAWEAVSIMCDETDTEVPDIWGNSEVRRQWLDAIKDEVLIKVTYLHNMQPLVAHTTPSRCEVFGVSWDKAWDALSSEVRMYAQWAAGEVYGYVIEEGKTCGHCNRTVWEEVDSCYGFYGRKIEANGMLDNVPSDMKEVLLNAEWVD